MWAIAAAAFLAIFVGGVAFPLIIIAAGLVGLVGGKFWPVKFDVISASHRSNTTHRTYSVLDDDHSAPEHTKPSLRRALTVASAWLVIWWTPVFLAGLLLGSNHTVFKEGIFFSKAAVVTFGGAYAVLPYVAQRAVDHFQWLTTGQMMDGLGLAETTPGPLIMVLQFVGFMGGWSKPGALSPLAGATLGALLTTWVTFVPSFLWIFLGGPYIERLRGNKRLAMTLSSVTAAVVGVILNLAVWFVLHVVHLKEGLDWFAIVLGLAALPIAMLRWKLGVIPVVLTAEPRLACCIGDLRRRSKS